METALKFLTPGIVFVLTVATGVWLSRSGKPLNMAIFTIHKLIALAVVVVTAMQMYTVLKGSNPQALLVGLIILAGICVVALFVTGALLSQAKPVSDILLTIHKVAPILAVIAMAAAFYLLAGRQL
jgi:hypothetical protein